MKSPSLSMSHNSDGIVGTGGLREIAALCVAGRSIYKHLPGVVAYDRMKNARTFPGGCPVVAHPPCRLWSKFLSHQAKSPDREAEMELGRWCVRQVLENGGVLEHPAGSRLFSEMGLPMPTRSIQSGFTMYIEQRWFGYGGKKATWVFVSGVPIAEVPSVPFGFDRANSLALSAFGRSRTMAGFARWLCAIARAANPPGARANAGAMPMCPDHA